MNIITRLTVLGKFSVRINHKRVKVMQKDYKSIVFLVTCLLSYPLVIYVYIVKYLIDLNFFSFNAVLQSSVLLVFAWMFLKTLQNLKAVLKHKEILIIDKQKRVIIHDDWEVKTAEIDHADIFRVAEFEGNRYQLVFYPKLKFQPSTPEMEEEVRESTAFYVFVPTATAKLLIVQLANEINVLTEKRIKLVFRFHIGDLVALISIFYYLAVFLICVFGVPVAYYLLFFEPLFR